MQGTFVSVPLSALHADRAGQKAADLQGMQQEGLTVFGDGTLPTDLTQTSYSTIPSVDVEVGDRASDHSADACEAYARGLKAGVDIFCSEGL